MKNRNVIINKISGTNRASATRVALLNYFHNFTKQELSHGN